MPGIETRYEVERHFVAGNCTLENSHEGIKERQKMGLRMYGVNIVSTI